LSQSKTKKEQIMENFVAEYGNALIALVSGILLIGWGWNKYVDHSRWLTESKKTIGKVVGIETVTLETESSVEEYDQPTFKYNTTGEIKVNKARQYFQKGELKLGDAHPVRYNHRTPGRIHSEQADDLSLLGSFLFVFIGGVLLLISLILFTA
jgi:hypothetical protein